METAEATLRKRQVAKDKVRGDLSRSPPSIAKGKQPGQCSLDAAGVLSAQVLTNRSAGGPATFTTEPLEMKSDVREASNCDSDGDFDKECQIAKSPGGKTEIPSTPSESQKSEAGESCATAVNSESEGSDRQREQIKQEEAKNKKSYHVCLIFFWIFALNTRLFNIEVPDHVW